MRADRSLGDRIRTAALVSVDATAYALAVTAAAIVVAGVASVATGGGLVRLKTALFLIGFLLMGYATIRLWPSSPDDVRGGTERGAAGGPATSEETRLESFVRTLPPLRRVAPPPPSRRIEPAGKLFVASLFVLLASYLMETVLGVA